MNCPDETRWTDLAVGEAPFADALRLRLHAARCERCARTLAETRRVVAHFAAPRRRAVVPVLAVGATAIAGIAAVALLPGSPTNPSVTFAHVEAAMAKIKTAHWTTTIERQGLRFDCWLRLDPPAYAFTGTKPWPVRTVIDARGMLEESRQPSLAYTRLDPWMTTRALRPNGTPRQWLLDMLLLPENPLAMDTQQGTILRNGRPLARVRRSPWRRSEAVLEGRRVLRFDCDQVTERDEPTHMILIPSGTTHLQVWVDPETLRVLRREDNADGLRTVSANFVYDETPPPGTFTIAPPRAGAPFLWLDLTDAVVPQEPAERMSLERRLAAALAEQGARLKSVDVMIGKGAPLVRHSGSVPFPPVTQTARAMLVSFKATTLRGEQLGVAEVNRRGKGFVVKQVILQAPQRPATKR